MAEGHYRGSVSVSKYTAVLQRWSILLGAWLGVSLFACGAILLARTMLDLPTPIRVLFILELPVWFFWVAAAVCIVRLSGRFPLDRTRPWTGLGVHLVGAIVAAALFIGFRMLWYQAFNPFPYLDTSVPTWYWRMFREHFVAGFTLYWAVVGVYHAFTNYARFRKRDVEARIIRGELAEARLDALRLQLRPHFLFNALNTVSSVLEENPRRARRIIGRLGELLRASLRTDTNALVPLKEELELVVAYLEIEGERFGGRLAYSVQVPDSMLDVRVPSFLLQPLVENAVRHGIAPREGPGNISLKASAAGDYLEIHVEDDGVGLTGGVLHDGIGLGNTRRRLRELYQGNASVTLAPRSSAGLDVRVRIPKRWPVTIAEGAA
jgi:two-component system, LytTR family, sensor kinase